MLYNGVRFDISYYIVARTMRYARDKIIRISLHYPKKRSIPFTGELSRE